MVPGHNGSWFVLQVYIAELDVDVPTCIERNIHNWTEYDVEKVKKRWEPTPNNFLRLDIRWLLQEDSITEVRCFL